MRPEAKHGFAIATLVVLLAAPVAARAGSLVLKKAFIEKYKNRATIEVKFTIDFAHDHPNSVKSDGEDGDLHMSGRAPLVGLPMVAEIVNAKLQLVALVFVKAQASKEGEVNLAGVWRLWFEHPPSSEQTQSPTVPKPTDTNPDHMFEIHPIITIGPDSVATSFVPIPNYQADLAVTAFPYYETRKVNVQATDSAVRLISPRAIHNYTEFVIELSAAPEKRVDGYTALAIVKDLEGNVVVPKPRRMVFAQGTRPADAVKGLKKGGKMHVLGIPRVNLEAISVLAQTAGPSGKNAFLPYEMIIVGVFPD